MNFNSLISLMESFKDEQTCIEHFKKIRFSKGLYCPCCGATSHIYELKDKKTFKCNNCNNKFSIKRGTIFEGSNIPLRKWFIAIYLHINHSKGISSIQLSKDINVTQKTAWFMLGRLREIEKSGFLKQSNITEIDESYIGGKEKNKHASKRKQNTQGRSTLTKAPVVGLLDREEKKIIAFTVSSVNAKTLENIVIKNVSLGSEVYSDEFKAYKGLGSLYNHKIVRHGLGNYANGKVHINTLEGFWSLFKRGCLGIYHSISRKHLQRYLNEYSFRYNNRELSLEGRFDLVLSISEGNRLTYKGITSW